MSKQKPIQLPAPCSPRELLNASCDADAFNLGATLAAASAASAVYRADCVEALGGSGWHWAQLFDIGPTQVVVATAPGVVMVSARGTDERADWVDNAASCREMLGSAYGRFAGMTVHRGFLRQTERIRESVVATVGLHASRESALIVNGHSLGSPIAALLAMAMLELPEVGKVEVYTFNSPRWLAADSLPQFQRHTVPGLSPLTIRRVVTSSADGVLDLVSRVPPERWGWTHVGELTVLDGANRYTGKLADESWRTGRAANPVGNLAAWRILTRVRRGIEAHRWSAIVDTLKRQSVPPEGTE